MVLLGELCLGLFSMVFARWFVLKIIFGDCVWDYFLWVVFGIIFDELYVN